MSARRCATRAVPTPTAARRSRLIPTNEDVMHQSINQVRLRGFLVGAAHLFVSRSGQARVAFRLEVWNNDHHPAGRKVPAGVDYFSIITFGEHKVLLPQLSYGREVFIT